ncbi:MAG: ATP-dependent metallopeptidase FtsH/Yme1/Tma family protein, partial [Gemmatimonadaceae bacterium]
MPPQPPVPKPPRKPPNWGSVSKTISFWILVILIPVAFIQFSGKGAEQAPEISYTQYDRELTAGNVAKVNIEAGAAITGDFKKKVLVNRREVSKFNVRLPVEQSEDEVARLRANNVEIQAQAARASFGAHLLAYLPILLIVAFWIFLFRQMQAGG